MEKIKLLKSHLETRIIEPKCRPAVQREEEEVLNKKV